jgi:hypothetical protein
MELASGLTARVKRTSTGTRITIPAPPLGSDGWALLLEALETADRYGSTDAGGRIRIWAEIEEDPVADDDVVQQARCHVCGTTEPPLHPETIEVRVGPGVIQDVAAAVCTKHLELDQ